jgi:hypothetical protein
MGLLALKGKVRKQKFVVSGFHFVSFVPFVAERLSLQVELTWTLL